MEVTVNCQKNFGLQYFSKQVLLTWFFNTVFNKQKKLENKIIICLEKYLT